ncbi:LacI family DNA-binding transcriptional regulator [Dactylosporangium sp. CA-233914]|uniref:LacI family DNA-binding transcriptional regulator n=1 Tax=Dactylosporangium sp. CA-233914 TaxID=3239934 RepID=UPI003D9352FE
MGYAEKRGGYWRARYKIEPGKYGTVQDATGAKVEFRTKREAKKAADEAEATGRRPVAPQGRMRFGNWANAWYERQDLAASTMQNYRRHIEEHLLPTFEDRELGSISSADVDTWAKSERAAGYAEASVKTWRGTLHLLLADAVDEGLIPSNPATKRRGRGKRAGRSRSRGPEKAITTALGVLLIAERAALLSGRDDEFTALVTLGFTGMRWGELVGLEAEYVRPAEVRIEWQLYELDSGEMHRCPPKDDSRRTVIVPSWLAGLLRAQTARSCSCHGRAYVFSGHRAANGAARQLGPKLVDVARRAGVSTGTVSAVLNERDSVAAATREKVVRAIADLGYVRGATTTTLAAHWRRTGFATWLFQPAATGRYPGKEPRPVPILGEPWPGVPVRGRNAAGRSDTCWVPIAPGLTPHGLRHTYKTLMIELGTPPVLMDEQLGHLDGSVQARYSHTTPEMRERLRDGLTDLWTAALEVRREIRPGSPVRVLDDLLSEGARSSPKFLPNGPGRRLRAGPS